MKDAAKRVVNTLGVSDYYTVIEFNNDAKVLKYKNDDDDEDLLIRATSENKQYSNERIDKLEPGGGTDFYSGFDLAYDVLDKSVLYDRTSGCHRAILFLTDGDASENGLYYLIEREHKKYLNDGKSAPVIFSYSFGAGANDAVPKAIACRSDGIWAKVEDGGDLAKSMGAYYKYFAYGLGDKVNEDFVAWVEPYEFSTGVGMGTTASAPVFDRTIDPPVLSGVVGMDIAFAALEKAFGDELGDSARNTVINQVILRSGAVCPKIELTPCQMESLRKYGSDDEGNDNALCSSCNVTISPLKAPLCPDYAIELWNNDLNKGRSYEERTCCNVGSEPRIKGELTYKEIKDLTCRPPNRVLLILAITFGSIVGIVVLSIAGCCCVRCYNHRKEQSMLVQNQSNAHPSSSIYSNNPSVNYSNNPNVNASMPPTAPYNPSNSLQNSTINPFEEDITVLGPPVVPTAEVVVPTAETVPAANNHMKY